MLRPSTFLDLAIFSLVTFTLAGCDGGGYGYGDGSSPQPPPTAFDQSDSTWANGQITDALAVTDVDWSTSQFYIDTWPSFGTLSVDPSTGDFTYTPDINYVGVDSFTWDCADQFGDSNIAQVDIDMTTVIAGTHHVQHHSTDDISQR